jgi:pimeloyl-ACP methyl ester carboxylesterase
MCFQKQYEQAWQAFIKPTRFTYYDDSLGYDEEEFKGVSVLREDFEIPNCDKISLQGTVFRPKQMPSQGLDIVIYLHTREGCRTQGMFLKDILLPRIGIVVIDFAGCGNSSAEYITLGHKESRDVKIVINHLKRTYNIRKIVLWGRSMGAVSSLLYAEDPNNCRLISGLILDSPFSAFNQMVEDIVKSKCWIPGCFISCFMFFVKRTIAEKTGADMDYIEPIRSVRKIDIPAYFMVGKDDLIAKPQRVRELFRRFKGANKEFALLEGEHSASREAEDIMKCVYFALKCFNDEFPTTQSRNPNKVNMNQ